MQLGGEGTPRVQEFCLGEIALARGTGVTATMNATADTLDLVFRLPKIWAVCETGGAESAHRPAGREAVRHLPADRVGVVDRAVARIIGHESGGRVLAVAEAKIIEADPPCMRSGSRPNAGGVTCPRRGPTSSGCAP